VILFDLLPIRDVCVCVNVAMSWTKKFDTWTSVSFRHLFFNWLKEKFLIILV